MVWAWGHLGTPHQGWACVSLRVTQRPTSVAVDTEAASWRKGGTTTNLPEGFLAPAQLGLQEAIEGSGQGEQPFAVGAVTKHECFRQAAGGGLAGRRGVGVEGNY